MHIFSYPSKKMFAFYLNLYKCWFWNINYFFQEKLVLELQQPAWASVEPGYYP